MRLTADRGFADEALFTFLETLGLRVISRVQGRVPVALDGQGRQRHRGRFVGTSRRRNLGRVAYCESAPHRGWRTMSRARDQKGHGGMWYLVRSQPLHAQQMATESGYRFGGEAGLRDTTWSLGFAQARVPAMQAGARLFALVAIALRALTSLGMRL